VAVKYALLYARAEEASFDEPSVRGVFCDNVITALLMLNSLIVDDQEALVSASPLAAGIRISFTQRQERFANTVARYFYLFDWSETSEAQASPEYLPLRADFLRLLGCTIEEYLFAFTVAYTQVGVLNSVADLSQKGAVLSLGTLLSTTQHPESVIRIFNETSIDVSDVKAILAETQGNAHSMLSLIPLLSKPFIRLENGDICIVSPKFVENAFGSAIFHRLADAYKRESGDKGRNRFTSFFGQFFESYVAKLFLESNVTGRRVLRECTYKGKNGNAKSTDVVVIENRDAVLLEVVAYRFPVVGAIRDVNLENIRTGLDNMLVDKFGQIADRFADFELGLFSLGGTTRSDLDKLFPVVVVIEPMLFELAIIQDTHQKAAAQLSKVTTEPLQIFDIESVEALCSVLRRGVSLSKLLAAKISSLSSASSGLKDYLVLSGLNPTETPEGTARLHAAFGVVLNKAVEIGVPGAG
jgi:hypothetical protein